MSQKKTENEAKEIKAKPRKKRVSKPINKELMKAIISDLADGGLSSQDIIKKHGIAISSLNKIRKTINTNILVKIKEDEDVEEIFILPDRIEDVVTLAMKDLGYKIKVSEWFFVILKHIVLPGSNRFVKSDNQPNYQFSLVMVLSWRNII